MNANDQTTQAQSPLQRAFIVASLACFFSVLAVYWVERPVVELLEVRWARILIYGLLPTSVTFIILYRSCWHREIAGVARTCSVLLLSCVIFLGAIAALGVLLCLAWFCLNAVTGGFHP